jgi:hypothetical protein
MTWKFTTKRGSPWKDKRSLKKGKTHRKNERGLKSERRISLGRSHNSKIRTSLCGELHSGFWSLSTYFEVEN